VKEKEDQIKKNEKKRQENGEAEEGDWRAERGETVDKKEGKRR
jgi:hypothetical protein